jgi:hypothetical protein
MSFTSELMGLGIAAEVAVELSQEIQGTIAGKPVVEQAQLINGDVLQYDLALDAWVTGNVTDGGNF